MQLEYFFTWNPIILKISHPFACLSINSRGTWQPVRSLHMNMKSAKEMGKRVKRKAKGQKETNIVTKKWLW